MLRCAVTGTASNPAAPGETRSGIQIASAAVAGVNKELDTLLVKLGERVVAADKNESCRDVINPLLAGAKCILERARRVLLGEARQRGQDHP